MPSALYVPDFETVPDLDQIPNLCSLSDELVPALDQDVLFDRYLREGKEPTTQQPFPPLSLHRIIVCALVGADIISTDSNDEVYDPRMSSGRQYEVYNIKFLNSTFNDSEPEILSALLPFLGRNCPRLVTYNGRGFEIPLMRVRSMRHKIPVPWLSDCGDRYNNYESRYSQVFHCDLMDVISRYGAARNMKLSEVASLCRLPIKVGHGKDVYQMYQDKEFAQIQAYCEIDSLLTFLVYINWQYVFGVMTDQGYKQSIQNVVTYLKSVSKTHFTLFLEQWSKLDTSVIV